LTLKKLFVHEELPPLEDQPIINNEPRDHYLFCAIYAGDDRYVQSSSGDKLLKVNRIPIIIDASVTSPVIAK
jgi:hypothetical protein